MRALLLEVIFVGEEGVDEGGVQKEFMQVVVVPSIVEGMGIGPECHVMSGHGKRTVSRTRDGRRARARRRRRGSSFVQVVNTREPRGPS